jgi:hypothetical protein
VGLFSAGRISRGDRFRAASYDASQAVIVNWTYTSALKLAIHRERPDMSDHSSFPSGHSSNAFAMASVFAKHYKKLAIPLYGAATYVAVSRMAANKHYFSDIVAGSSLGWVIGRSVVRRNSRPPDGEAPKPTSRCACGGLAGCAVGGARGRRHRTQAQRGVLSGARVSGARPHDDAIAHSQRSMWKTSWISIATGLSSGLEGIRSRMYFHHRLHTSVAAMAFQRSSLSISAYANSWLEAGRGRWSSCGLRARTAWPRDPSRSGCGVACTRRAGSRARTS